jgi:hypothetical protein
MATLDEAARCPAAHPDDRTGCDNAPDAVRIVDASGAEVYGCVHHAAVLLAFLTGGRVYPSTVPGAAIDTYRRAARLTPFDGRIQAGGR